MCVYSCSVQSCFTVSLLCSALFPVLRCVYCSSACQSWDPVCFLSRPSPFLSFVWPACFLSFSRCLFWIAVLVPSLLPSLSCVCVCRESKIEKGKVTKSVRWQNLHAKPVEIFFRFDSVHVALTQKVIVCMRVCVNCVQTTSYHAEESRS